MIFHVPVCSILPRARGEADPPDAVGAANASVQQPTVIPGLVAERAAGAKGRVADGGSYENHALGDVHSRLDQNRAGCHRRGRGRLVLAPGVTATAHKADCPNQPAVPPPAIETGARAGALAMSARSSRTWWGIPWRSGRPSAHRTAFYRSPKRLDLRLAPPVRRFHDLSSDLPQDEIGRPGVAWSSKLTVNPWQSRSFHA